MTGNDLANWRRVMKMNISQASDALKISRTTLYKWENNKRNDIPYHIGLACAAIYHRFPAWPARITTE